jgi:hypothetical protein
MDSQTRCPDPADLVGLLWNPAAPNGDLARHAEACATCRQELEGLAGVADQLRRNAVTSVGGGEACLTDEQIAACADVELSGAEHVTFAHLADCPHCRLRLRSILQLLNDPDVRRGLEWLHLPARVRWPTRRMAAGLAATAMAAAAGVLLFVAPRSDSLPRPGDDAADVPLHRENAITTTIAPHVVGPAGVSTAADSLRWTSVPHADLYSVRVFDRDGTLVWNPQTPDTVLPVPTQLQRADVTTYLWKVEARTSWDRWVSSDWADLTIASPHQP